MIGCDTNRMVIGGNVFGLHHEVGRPMRLTVLGSSGTFPGSGNPGASFLIGDGGTVIWCDAGPGSFLSLIEMVDPASLDGIVISHQHPDHCIDLVTAYHALTFRPDPVSQMAVFAPQSVIDRIAAFVDAGPDHRLFSTFRFIPTEGGDHNRVGTIDMEMVTMDHSVPTIGTVFRTGTQSVFYTADTGDGGRWTEQVGPVDLLVSEASLQGTPAVSGVQHLTARQAGEIGARIGATRLLLTHIPPYLDPIVSVREAEETFGRTVMIAVPGATHEV